MTLGSYPSKSQAEAIGIGLCSRDSKKSIQMC